MNNTIRKREYLKNEGLGKEKKLYQVEKKGEHLTDITIRCKCCNQFLLGYDLVHDDDKRILERLTLPACRCKRVLRLMNYTEGLLRKQAVDNIVRI